MSKAQVGLLLVLALVARCALFAVNELRTEPRFLVPDSYSYLSAAQSLASHGALLDSDGKPGWGRVPGYPLLLAALFTGRLATPDRLEAAVILQILLGTALVLVATKLAADLAGRSAAWIVGLVLALEPSLVAYSNVVLSEILYGLFLVLALVVLARWKERPTGPSLLVLALLTGALPLIRPIGAFVPVLLGGVLGALEWRRSRRLGSGLLLVLVACAPEALWCWRNHRAMGTAELHYTGPWGRAFFAHAVEESLGIAGLESAEGEVAPWEFGFWNSAGRSSAEAFEIENRYFIRTLEAHPWASLRQLARNAVLLVGVPDSLYAEIALEHPPSFEGGIVTERLRWVVSLGSLGLLVTLGSVLSVAGVLAIPVVLWKLSGHRDFMIVVTIALLAVYHLGMGAFVPDQGERYRVPVIPLLAILTMLGVRSFLRKGKEGLPGPYLPSQGGRMSSKGPAGADRNGMAAPLHQRTVGHAVAVGPRIAPRKGGSERLAHHAPDLLLASTVRADEVGQGIPGRSGAHQGIET